MKPVIICWRSEVDLIFSSDLLSSFQYLIMQPITIDRLSITIPVGNTFDGRNCCTNISFCFRKNKQFTGDVKCYFLKVYQALKLLWRTAMENRTGWQKLRKHFTRDKVLPSSPQGTSPVIVRNEGFSSCWPERFSFTCFCNEAPMQVSLEANKIFPMSHLIKII